MTTTHREIATGTACTKCGNVYIKPCNGLDATCQNSIAVDKRAAAKADKDKP